MVDCCEEGRLTAMCRVFLELRVRTPRPREPARWIKVSNHHYLRNGGLTQSTDELRLHYSARRTPSNGFTELRM